MSIYFERERVDVHTRTCEQGRAREREREKGRESQVGSVLLVQSLMRASVSGTVRS